MKARTWTLAGLALIIGLMVSCAAVLGSLTYFVVKRVEIHPIATERDADREIGEVEARFNDEAPLITHRDGDDDRIMEHYESLHDRLEERARHYSGRLPDSLHVLVWDSNEEKLVRFNLPLWLLKLKTGPIDINAGGLRLSRFRVTAEDLQRAGPALVLDYEDKDVRLLVWTE